MTFEQALASKLIAVVGHSRVFPDAIPDANVNANQWPCVVYARAGGTELFTLNGERPKDHETFVTLTIWGPDRVACAATRDLIRDAFGGVNAQGKWGGADGVYVAGATANDFTAGIDPANDSSDRHTRSESLQLKVFWYG